MDKITDPPAGPVPGQLTLDEAKRVAFQARFAAALEEAEKARRPEVLAALTEAQRLLSAAGVLEEA